MLEIDHLLPPRRSWRGGLLAVLLGLMLIGAAMLLGSVAHGESPPVIGDLAVEQAGGPESGRLLPPAPTPGLPSVRVLPDLRASADHPYDPTPEERILVDAAAYRCELAGPRFLRPGVALAMLRAEETAGAGPGHPLRGVSLAAWCGEAAYGLGDEVCRTGPCDGGKARGPLQIHAGYARMCVGLPYGGPATAAADALRDHPEHAVRCYLRQVERAFRKTRCKSAAEAWITAELWIARGQRPRCGEASGHVMRLRKWRRAFVPHDQVAGIGPVCRGAK